MSASEGSSIDNRFNTVLAEYLAAVESGQAPDREQLLKDHPEVAAQLQEFFENHDALVGRVATEASSIEKPGEAPTLSHGTTATDVGLNELPCDFADYELLSEIDRGGMGVIYKARQKSLDRIVALKMIKSGQLANEEEIARFHVEAEAAASLTHPSIVSIYEVGEHRGIHFFSMQFIDGESLATCLTDGPMPPREAAALVMKVAQAVSYAHEHAVVHRDLKPANVLLDEAGEPHIADFGLAKRLSRESNLTATGQILGTPAFMAPEQAAGRDRAVNELVDVYSIGAILYAVLTGRAPFEAATEIDVLLRVLDSDPKPPGKVVRGLPKQLDQICLHCLEKNPARRYATAAAMAEDLENHLKGEPLQMKTGGFLQSVRRWARREPALFVHTAAILCFLTVLQISHYTTNSPLDYHMKHVTTMLVWLALSFALQRAMNRPALENATRFVWATIDVALLTLILYMADPPRGLLLVGYPALIAASGMFVRVRLVVFTTIATVVGFLALVYFRPAEVVKPHFAMFYVLGVIVIGSLISTQVRRIRALGRYYESR